LDSELRKLDPSAVLTRMDIDSSGLPRFGASLHPAGHAQGRRLVQCFQGRAAEICELCGAPGRVRAGAVLTVRCGDC